MKKRYDEIMDKIEVTDEMRARILNHLQEVDLTKRTRPKVLRLSSVKKYLSVAACFAILLAGVLTLPGLLDRGLQRCTDDTRGKVPETICKNDLIKKTDQHRAGKTLPGASLFRKRIPLYRSEPARKNRSLKTVTPLLEAVQVSHEVITAAERVFLVSSDAVEGCDPRLFIQPDRLGNGILACVVIHMTHPCMLRFDRFCRLPGMVVSGEP